MPRKPTPPQTEFPYHLGARCINRDWFNVPMDDVWQIMSEQLHFLRHSFNFRIHSFVLMSNHFHLLASTPEGNLSEAMAWFMRETSRRLTKESGRINHTYGGRYFRTVIRRPHHFLHAYKYVYLNPVKAGIVSDVLDYPYSTLPALVGRSHTIIPTEEDHTLFSDVERTLTWLKSCPQNEEWFSVSQALKRPEFRLARQKKRPHVLEKKMF